MKALVLVALVSLAAPAVQAEDWNRGAAISITMTNHGFVPHRIVLRRGTPYVLRFRNVSDRAHNFAARTFFDYARVSPRDQNWVRHDEVVLKAGERAAVHIVAPTTPGARYDFRSTRIEDAGADMKGTIYVR
jgi:hypothetical protein